MKITRILAMALMVGLLAACGPVESLHPLFEPKDRIEMPALVGGWIGVENHNEPDGTQLTIKGESDKTYEIVFTVDNENKKNKKTTHFRGEFGRVGDFVFLDVYTDSEAIGDAPAVPVHQFFLVGVAGDSLELAYMDDDGLREEIQEGRTRIAHKILCPSVPQPAQTKDIVAQSWWHGYPSSPIIRMTAQTKDLQVLALEYAKEAEALRLSMMQNPSTMVEYTKETRAIFVLIGLRFRRLSAAPAEEF